jgi:hypothetical protein
MQMSTDDLVIKILHACQLADAQTYTAAIASLRVAVETFRELNDRLCQGECFPSQWVRSCCYLRIARDMGVTHPPALEQVIRAKTPKGR